MGDLERAQLPHLRALVVVVDRELRSRCVELLEGEGMLADELAEGADALAAVRRQAPDLVVCDAGSAGAALAEGVGADFAIRHVKLVPLQAGELDRPPESPGRALVDRVRETLAARLAFEAGLDGGEGVSGRVEDVGARAILEAISRRRRDRRLTVWIEQESLIAEFRGGELYSLEYSATHADPCSGTAALEKLLALDEAVFEVAPQAADPGRQFQRGLDEEIESAAARLNAVAAGRDPGPVVGAVAVAPAGGGGLHTTLRVAVVLIVLALVGAGVFVGIRMLLLGSVEEDEQDASGALSGLEQGDETGVESGARVSEAELERLEAALRRGAAAVMPPALGATTGQDAGVDGSGSRPPEAAEPAAGDDGVRSEGPPRAEVKTRPRGKGEPPKQDPGGGHEAKPPKKKGDPDVEAMIDDLGIKFD